MRHRSSDYARVSPDIEDSGNGNDHEGGVDNISLISLIELETLAVHSSNETIQNSHENTVAPGNKPAPTWMPRMLRWHFAIVPTALSLSLCIIVSILCWYSKTNHGLGPDDGTAALLFGWRFLPTLIAVLYNELVFMLWEDVKRTEPYARMAKYGGASARWTILQGPSLWWTAFVQGFGNKKKGIPSSIALVCATSAFIIGSIIISPLSSTILQSGQTAVERKTDFLIMGIPDGGSLHLQADRETYFRTIGNILRNVPKSAWIGDTYFVLPLRPADMHQFPLSPSVSDTTGSWSSESLVFKADYECEPLTLSGRETFSRTKPVASDNYWRYKVKSPGGCEFQVEGGPSARDLGSPGLTWASLAVLRARDIDGSSGYQRLDAPATCGDRDIILARAGEALTKNFTVYGELCTSMYSVARMPVTVSTRPASASVLQISPDDFQNKRVPLSKEILDEEKIYNMTMLENWGSYMAYNNRDSASGGMGSSEPKEFDGPSAVLGAAYDYSISKIIQQKSLAKEAKRFRQRALGEILQYSLSQADNLQLQRHAGSSVSFEKRVVVITETVILLAAMLFVSFLFMSGLLLSSQLHQRPLNLYVDPSTPLGLASLVASDRGILSSLKSLDQTPKSERKHKLKDIGYATSSGRLYEISYHNQRLKRRREEKPQRKLESLDWRPAVLRLRYLTILAVFLTLLTVGLIVLKHFADQHELSQTAFVYQTQISFFNKTVPTIAPYSVLPTFLAVVVSLWWDSLDKSLRGLQPYISMSKSSPSLKKGAGMQYQTSYWVWAAFRAVKNQHWLLLVITIGSTLSQVFVVSMSALFERQPHVHTQPFTTNRSLELRQVPHLFEVLYDFTSSEGYVTWRDVIQRTYENSTTNWLYTATIQLTLGGPEPAWSRQGWSFVPVSLPESKDYSPEPSERFKDNAEEAKSGTWATSINITIPTFGVRARLECEHVPGTDSFGDSSDTSWLMEWDFTDDSVWNTTSNPKDLKSGYMPARYLFENTTHNTSLLSLPSLVYCCENGTMQGENSNSAIGYWSTNNGAEYPHPDRAWPINFTSKWIHGGSTRTDYYLNNSFADEILNDPENKWAPLMFSEVPRLQALNCKPVIETANTSIVVDSTTGQVHHFEIIDQPKPAEEAWSDAFVLRLNSSGIDDEFRDLYRNSTLSYGVYFIDALLGAAQLLNYGQDDEFSLLEDNTFNVRDRDLGLNLDFMSFAMYTLAGKDPEALLDEETLKNLTQFVFSAYFQHFVSSNFSHETGGFAYQRIGESLEVELPYHIDNSTLGNMAGHNGPPTAYAQLNTNRTVVGTISTAIEVLDMNSIATWLSVGILIYLILATLLFAALQRSYLSPLIRNFESPADVLVAIANSENFLDMVRDSDHDALRKSEDRRARLGWFKDVDGNKRWGVEVVGGNRPVEWIVEPEA